MKLGIIKPSPRGLYVAAMSICLSVCMSVRLFVCRQFRATVTIGWLRGTVVFGRRSLTGELSLSSARPAADG